MISENILGYSIYSILVSLITNFVCIKFNKLVYNPKENHKEKFKEKIIVSGGLIIFIYINTIYFFFQKSSDLELFYLLTIFIFFIGLFSDLKNLSASLRLLLISILSIFFIWITKNYILDFKFELINDFLDSNILLAIIFTSICFIILVNGYNFIDGVHGLTILYTIVTLFLLSYFYYFILNQKIFVLNLLYLIPILVVVYFLNIKEKIFLGDSGSYYLASIIGILIIEQSTKEDYSHPYVYACILIYPAYEVFFSIFRKFYLKKNPLSPDRMHLHHLLKNFLQISKKLSHQKASIISGIIINILILVFGFISIHFYQNKYILIFNIILFSALYTIFYFILYKKYKNIEP